MFHRGNMDDYANMTDSYMTSLFRITTIRSGSGNGSEWYYRVQVGY